MKVGNIYRAVSMRDCMDGSIYCLSNRGIVLNEIIDFWNGNDR